MLARIRSAGMLLAGVVETIVHGSMNLPTWDGTDGGDCGGGLEATACTRASSLPNFDLRYRHGSGRIAPDFAEPEKADWPCLLPSHRTLRTHSMIRPTRGLHPGNVTNDPVPQDRHGGGGEAGNLDACRGVNAQRAEPRPALTLQQAPCTGGLEMKWRLFCEILTRSCIGSV